MHFYKSIGLHHVCRWPLVKLLRLHIFNYNFITQWQENKQNLNFKGIDSNLKFLQFH